MKNRNKLFLILSAIGIILIAVGIFIFINNKEDNKKELEPSISDEPVIEISDKLSAEHEYNNVSVDDFKITGELKYTIEFDITNNTDKDYELMQIEIIFFREDGSIFNIVPIFIEDVKKGETKHHSLTTYSDYRSAYDYRLNVIE